MKNKGHWIRKNGKLLRQMGRQDWWLMDAVRLLRSDFRRIGWPLPPGILVVHDELWSWKGARGECWQIDGKVVKRPRIIIADWLTDPVMVLKTLTHELGHVAAKEIGHNAAFDICTTQIGLLGEHGQWPLSVALLNRFDDICKKLGPFLTHEQTRKQKQNR